MDDLDQFTPSLIQSLKKEARDRQEEKARNSRLSRLDRIEAEVLPFFDQAKNTIADKVIDYAKYYPNSSCEVYISELIKGIKYDDDYHRKEQLKCFCDMIEYWLLEKGFNKKVYQLSEGYFKIEIYT